MSKKVIPGVNIQWPWSQMIATGEKRVETRTYPLPQKYIGQELAIIETPGPRGKKEAGIVKARIIGTVIFSGSFQYLTKEDWTADYERHLVKIDDGLFGWSDEKSKWGWEVVSIKYFNASFSVPERRGILFSTSCLIQGFETV